MFVAGGGCCRVVDFGSRKIVSPLRGWLVVGVCGSDPGAGAAGLPPRWGLLVGVARLDSRGRRRRATAGSAGLAPRATGFRPYWGFAEWDGRFAVA